MSGAAKTSKKPLHHHLLGKTGNIILIVVICASFASSIFLARSSMTFPQMAAVISQSLVALTNADREQSALGTLQINPLLEAAAQAKANDMAEKGYFAHISPEGLDSWHWFSLVGYNYSYAGENLAVDFGDSGDVERAWLNSPTHRANIMNSHYTEIGIATAVGVYQGHTTTFVVQMFGAPRRSVVPKTVTAPTLPTLAIAPLVKTPEPVTAVVAGVATTAKPVVKVSTSSMVTTAANEEATTPTSTIASDESSTHHPATALSNYLASPKALLHVLYLFFAAFILIAACVQTIAEWKQRHVRHLIVGGVFLFVMLLLFTYAELRVFSPPVLLPQSASQSR